MLRSANHRWEVLSLSERRGNRVTGDGKKLPKEQRQRILLRLSTYLWANRWGMGLALLLTFAANIANLYIPSFSGKAIDAIGTSGNVNFDLVYYYCRILLAMVVINCVFSYLAHIVLVKVSANITMTMRRQVFEHLLTMPVSFFDRHQAGDIISRISYDIDTINTSLSSDLITILTSTITVVGSAIMMLRISAKLCVIFVFTIPLIIFVTRQRTRKVRPLFQNRSRLLGLLNGFAEEMLSGHKTIKAYGQEETIIAKFDEKNKESVDAYYEADYQGTLVGPTVQFINNLSLSLVSGFGAVLYLFGQITIGNISSFTLYSRKFSGPISETANLLAELQSAISAANRVFNLLDEPGEKADDEDAYVFEKAEGSVVFDKLHFSYVEGTEILHGIDIDAKPGQMVAIVGPTGAGKTTIINLLMRFYDPDSGTISVDGHDILHSTRDSVRKQFSMVLQDTWLFEGTIYENVAYGNDNASREDVERVCRAAHMHDFIMSLKNGYDTVLTDSGVNISKGQKQLLTIARAMLSDSRMLILDEATSNVDSHTEQLIQDAMLELCKGKTTFIIAHRLSTIKTADQILVLNHGTLIERGTHESLLAQKGFYAGLFNAQWEN
ncbi:MAG: ABC transporter ATP-binding protein [Erysipelotrichaceae bacterium]|nr:ABC transporter ATP-binding protein [Erysipelotrichaceae bacterium]